MNPFDHLHPAVVHFPIALLIVASAAGLLYMFAWQRAELRSLVWITMLIGWVSALVAVLTGLMAQQGLPPRPPYAITINLHIGGGVAILVVYGALLYRAWIWRQRASRRSADSPHDLLDVDSARWFNAILLIAGAALVVYTGYNGGQLVYVWGVNVAQ